MQAPRADGRSRDRVGDARAHVSWLGLSMGPRWPASRTLWREVDARHSKVLVVTLRCASGQGEILGHLSGGAGVQRPV